MSDDASVLLTGMISSAPLDISVTSLSLLASPCSLGRQTFSPSPSSEWSGQLVISSGESIGNMSVSPPENQFLSQLKSPSLSISLSPLVRGISEQITVASSGFLFRTLSKSVKIVEGLPDTLL